MTAQLVRYPNAASVCLAFLREQLPPLAPGVAVHHTVPTQRPKAFVQLRRVGGVTQNAALDRPRIDVLIWHEDDFQAEALAQLVRGLLLHRLPNFGPARHVREFMGPTANPDEATGAARYMLTVEITMRGQA